MDEAVCQQSTIYVHPLQHLRRKKVCHLTRKDTTENSCILVRNVGSISQLETACGAMWTFTEVNTSARNAANVVEMAAHWQHTDEVIQERNRLTVVFVANDLQRRVNLYSTAELTAETNLIDVGCARRRSVSPELWAVIWESTPETSRTSVTYATRRLVSLEVWRDTWQSTRETNSTDVTYVTRHSVSLKPWTFTWESTLETNRTSVHCVIEFSVSRATCCHIIVVYTATEDCFSVRFVGTYSYRSLLQTLGSCLMIWYT